MITSTYCKSPNHAIEECPVLLAKIQEKQQSQNVQLNGIEQWTTDTMVIVVTHSGVVTSRQPTKPSGAWVRKAEDKRSVVDLEKIKETFVHASIGFCIPDLPLSKEKEP